MARSWYSVRPIGDDDWSRLHALWRAAAAELPMGVDALSRPLTVDRLRRTLTGQGITVLLLEHASGVVGVAVLTTSPLSGLTNDAGLTVEFLYVEPEHRGRGAAGQLLARAALEAEAAGATHVATTAPAALKSANRFYARRGFNAAMTRRVAPTNALRRRLAAEVPAGAETVVARRRSLRARALAARQRGVDALGLAEVSAPEGHTV